ncbi:SDR family oxidoreductase [Cesiribacter andamanensis]|uniref:Short chain dehydrogenase n=1 Tax=Cesiribacter andamanensis AMV16 TaxID=1279009 RepID=M7NKU2_9BACT|nr:SDR family oxidoreductase [Cesiribacter andamanensis]EMR02410.1 short chain dehydrogenase [Cesiribacter andamanensis AMV16]
MKILLTGANGYIGRRLLPLLVQQGIEVVCLVRDARRLALEPPLAARVQVYEADLRYPEQLEQLPQDLDAAYYLVHSMGSTHQNFHAQEQQSALHFRQALEKTRARQIIYLSGISNDAQLSPHLQSRRGVEELLADGLIPLTVLRAAIIIGSGSASFEIIRDLVEKLPLMVAPRWVETRCQPIAVYNVMQYLLGVLLLPQALGQTFDIGGPDVLSYKQMILQFARQRGLRRYILTVPVLTPRLSSYWLYFVTATSYPLAVSLVGSMRNEVVCQDNRIRALVPQQLIPYREAVAKAFDKIAQNEVVSSWKDSLISSQALLQLQQYIQVPRWGCFVDKREIPFEEPREKVLQNIWSIGGERGWYYLNGLWKLRGRLDKLAGGVGLRRGRRSPSELQAGDALDFWRVLLANRQEGRLLLYAEMKLPGEAWLEFCIRQQAQGQHVLVQTATFRPRGLAGRLYWYSLLPFHHFIFEGMARQIIHSRWPAGPHSSPNSLEEQPAAL